MMVPEELFSLALGLVPPWLVDHVTFTVEEKRLDCQSALAIDHASAPNLCHLWSVITLRNSMD